MPEYSDPAIQWGLQKGESLLGTQAATEKRGLRKYLGAYGTQASPEFMATTEAAQGQAGRVGLQRLRAQMGEAQLRQDLWNRHMKNLYQAFKQRKANDRQAMYMTMLGAAGQIGGGAIGGIGGGGGGGGYAASQPFSMEASPYG